jgi:hypothetical protein
VQSMRQVLTAGTILSIENPFRRGQGKPQARPETFPDPPCRSFTYDRIGVSACSLYGETQAGFGVESLIFTLKLWPISLPKSSSRHFANY